MDATLGFDVDICQAVAAAIFGDASKARFIGLNGAQRLPALQSGQVDLVIQTLTQTKRLLGLVGDYGKFMALDNKWAFSAIKAVGNYGEIFERNFGPLKMPRGKNALWSKGGRPDTHATLPLGLYDACLPGNTSASLTTNQRQTPPANGWYNPQPGTPARPRCGDAAEWLS